MPPIPLPPERRPDGGPVRPGHYELLPIQPPEDEGFAQAVAKGLQSDAKSLPCRFLYDERGSQLFDRITQLDDYYPTRAERSILVGHADEVARSVAAPAELVELGSGSAAKTRVLIEALLRGQPDLRFVPIDISPGMLDASSRALLADYASLEVRAIEAEYEAGLREIGRLPTGRTRLIAWLGSSIGNLSRHAALAFVTSVGRSMRDRDRLLLGIDRRKDAATLERAYDDREGVTAAFNLNLLERINRELGGDFDLDAFHHRAVYLDGPGRVEMHLVSRVAQRVAIDELGCEIALERGEAIHTESAYKYSPGEVAELAAGAGLRVERSWTDAAERFSLNLLAPA